MTARAVPLRTLRRVNAMQTHARPANFQRVAVDHPSRSRDRRTRNTLPERIAHRAHAVSESWSWLRKSAHERCSSVLTSSPKSHRACAEAAAAPEHVVPEPSCRLTSVHYELGPKQKNARERSTLFENTDLRSLAPSSHEFCRIYRRVTSGPGLVAALLHPPSDHRGPQLRTRGPEGRRDPAPRPYTVTGKDQLYSAQHSSQGHEHAVSRFGLNA